MIYLHIYAGGKGTVLGLALVRQILKVSGGRLGAKSKQNEGSTFWVELSLGVEIPAATPAKRARQRADKAARQAEEAKNTQTTRIEAFPTNDPPNDSSDHSALSIPDFRPIPGFFSSDYSEHAAIWQAAISEGFRRGIKAGFNAAEVRIKQKLERLEGQVKTETERANRRLWFQAQNASGQGKEEGVNEERTRWLALYPDTAFSEFNEDVFPETVPLAAAKPPPPATRSIATQVTPATPTQSDSSYCPLCPHVQAGCRRRRYLSQSPSSGQPV
ncbi:hypothetical protein EST38_g11395 [Candolleomyces aberdarensis]|uniref:Uncharacterized protein n=1 Tax=Candolleomyces aberdarensis TaxID=2316362 RepID=A0A4Q2D4X6_9AGAR|nr:hypothetical protein EST38_g11395 [Candolleomyces aberdarensis]